jgi:lipopolysaccharide/colanic/teichoic acid biosynthesis glycosyltransferase
MTAGSIEVTRIVGDYAHRHRVKPGITGWAQVNGSRGPCHTPAEVRERVRLDMEYVNRASLWLDLWIILRTLPCLFGDRERHR